MLRLILLVLWIFVGPSEGSAEALSVSTYNSGNQGRTESQFILAQGPVTKSVVKPVTKFESKTEGRADRKFESTATDSTDFVELKNYPGISVDSRFATELSAQFLHRLKGDPLILNLAGKGSDLSKWVLEERQAGRVTSEFVDVNATAGELVKQIMSTPVERPIIVIAHMTSNQTRLSNLSGTESIHWSDVSSVIESKQRLVFLLGCNSASISGIGKGVAGSFDEVGALQAIAALKDAKSVGDLYLALTSAGVSLRFFGNSSGYTAEGKFEDGNPVHIEFLTGRPQPNEGSRASIDDEEGGGLPVLLFFALAGLLAIVPLQIGVALIATFCFVVRLSDGPHVFMTFLFSGELFGALATSAFFFGFPLVVCLFNLGPITFLIALVLLAFIGIGTYGVVEDIRSRVFGGNSV